MIDVGMISRQIHLVLIQQLMQKLAYKIGNRLVGKSEYLLITYELTEFILRIEAKYSPVVQCLILTS